MIFKSSGLFASSFLYGLLGVSQRLSSLILLPLFTHYLTPADYGVVGLLAVLPSLLLPIFSMGLGASISVCYFAPQYSKTRQEVIDTSFKLTYLSAALIFLLGFVQLDWITQVSTGGLEYKQHTLIALFTLAFTVLSLPLQLELQFLNRPQAFVIITFISTLFSALSSALFIIWFDYGALGMLLGGMIGQAILWLSLAIRRNNINVKKRFNSQIALALIKDGVPLLPSFIFLFIMQNAVRWSIQSNQGVDAVGLYSIGSNLGSTLSLVTAGFVTAWMPWVMELRVSWEQQRYLVAKRLTQYTVILGVIVLLFFCIAQPLLLVLTPHNYFDAWKVVGLSAAINFMMSLFTLLLAPVYMAGKVYLVLIPQFFAAVASIVFVKLLLGYGLIGASIGVLLASIIMVILQLIVNAKLTSILPIPLNFKALIKTFLLIGLGSGATFWLEVNQMQNFIFFVLIVIFTIIPAALKYFPDIQLLLKKIRGFS